jgi:hypothetical protein
MLVYNIHCSEQHTEENTHIPSTTAHLCTPRKIDNQRYLKHKSAITWPLPAYNFHSTRTKEHHKTEGTFTK